MFVVEIHSGLFKALYSCIFASRLPLKVVMADICMKCFHRAHVIFEFLII